MFGQILVGERDNILWLSVILWLMVTFSSEVIFLWSHFSEKQKFLPKIVVAAR